MLQIASKFLNLGRNNMINIYNVSSLLCHRHCWLSRTFYKIEISAIDLEKQSILCINQFQARTFPGQAPGEFFEVVKSPCQGAKFSCKSTAPGAKTPAPCMEYFRRSYQPFLLTGVEILGFCRNQILKRTGRLSNYSLVIPSSFSLSTIFHQL